MSTIDTETLKTAIDTNAIDGVKTVLLDVRSPSEYSYEHIPRARNIPLETLEAHKEELTGAETIYVYCASGGRGKTALDVLASMGCTSATQNMEGGIYAWKDAGYDVTTHRQAIPIRQQVLLMAVTLIILGVLLSLFIL